MEREYYSVLGVNTYANDAEIISAYRKLSVKFHPDANNGDQFFEERFREIQKAYTILINPIKRAVYDSELDKRFFREAPQKIDNKNPIITIFDISKKNIEDSEPITIRWQTVHADDVFINCLGKVEAEGTKTLRVPGLAGNESSLIIITALNSFNSEKAVKEIEIKNKSYKISDIISLESDIGRSVIKTQTKQSQNTKEEVIKEEITTKKSKNELSSKKEIKEKRKTVRKLSKEEILAGVDLDSLETDEIKRSFKISDVYVYIVLLVLLVIIIFMAVVAYNLNPVT